ncbi:DUF484 family protein [Phytohalomonas tamaricis]|uniref:DUF484 family protein n=1 Tax=Phytohalomonas tamaricis TaxID=2081032 RepID=UPI000D0BB52D|nr:DUF484 family protein [Phytohalomonas tamaricis]
MSRASAIEPRRTLDPEQVAQWLVRHPDFFVGREGLLQQLKVPHPEARDGAISLLERLVHDLRHRADGAEQRLNALLDTARHNEAQYQRVRELILVLLETDSRDAMAQTLATTLSERFKVRAVALWRPVLPGDPPAEALQPPTFALNDTISMRLEALLDGHHSRCCSLDADSWRHLLPVSPEGLSHGSCAVTRLALGTRQGYLIIANPDPEYFRATLGTLFVDYLGDVVGRLLIRNAA